MHPGLFLQNNNNKNPKKTKSHCGVSKRSFSRLYVVWCGSVAMATPRFPAGGREGRGSQGKRRKSCDASSASPLLLLKFVCAGRRVRSRPLGAGRAIRSGNSARRRCKERERKQTLRFTTELLRAGREVISQRRLTSQDQGRRIFLNCVCQPSAQVSAA